LIQVEMLAFSRCRSDQWQWLWRRQRCRFENMNISETLIQSY